jgi:CRP-like cAMP-binding protein
MISPERLRRFSHHAGCSEEVLQAAAMFADNRTFKAGERIFSEGNEPTHLMFLEQGEVDVVYRLGDGREVVVDTLVPGDTLAWSAVVKPHVLSASAVGKRDGRLIRIEAQGLRRLCAENPSYGYRLMNEIARVLRSRLIATRVQLAAMS